MVWSLRHLFAAPYAPHLVFKGGTSLSKAYAAIQRFSEDVDLTYDIRAIAGDLIGDAGTPLPASKSQEKKWSKEIRTRLADRVTTEVVLRLQQSLGQHGLPATARAEGDKVFIDYTPLVSGTGYVPPTVMLESGARSTGEPCELRSVHCDAAAHLRGVEFPEATPQVMRAERTFWEKATAIHVFCMQSVFRGDDRFARHWHDVTRPDVAGLADSAIADTALAKAVADHKSIFFAESIRMVHRSTTTPPSQAVFASFPMTAPWSSWPPTTSTWLTMACSSMRSSRSTALSETARSSKRKQMRHSPDNRPLLTTGH